MAITISTVSTGTTVGTSTSLTISHTVGAGECLVVTVQADAGNAPSSVTYNGGILTMAVEVNGGLHASSWYIVNPDIGTFNIQINYASAQHITGEGISILGANPSAFIDGTNTGTGTTNDAAISVITSVNTSFIIASIFHNRNSSQTAIASSTIQANVYNVSDNFRGLAVTRSTTTPGSYNVGETMGTASDGWSIAAMGIKSNTGVATGNFFLLM